MKQFTWRMGAKPQVVLAFLTPVICSSYAEAMLNWASVRLSYCNGIPRWLKGPVGNT